MKVGDMKHRIKIMKPSVSTNENGFTVEQLEEYRTVWASAMNLFGKEYFEAAAIQNENTVKFIIRYLPGLTNDMQIWFNHQNYIIIHIDNIKYKNEYIEIKAVIADQKGQ